MVNDPTRTVAAYLTTANIAILFRSPASWVVRCPKWFCLSNAELGYLMVCLVGKWLVGKWLVGKCQRKILAGVRYSF